MNDGVQIAFIGGGFTFAGLLVSSAMTWWQSRDIRQKAVEVHKQVTNNGGSSLKDAVDRIEGKLLPEVVDRLARAEVEADHAAGLAHVLGMRLEAHLTEVGSKVDEMVFEGVKR